MAGSSPFSCGSLSSDSDVSNVLSPGFLLPDVSWTQKRPRCRNPSKQRRNASEKEKLRMRDLTKALHYLRTFLPPFVAPVGRTLTKIETLRLAIRYISYLSAQLHLQMALNPEFTSPLHDTITHTAGNLETEALQFQHIQPPEETWTPPFQKTSSERLHSGDVHGHMTLQSESGFMSLETGQKGGIEVDNFHSAEIFDFHTPTTPRLSQSLLVSDSELTQ